MALVKTAANTFKRGVETPSASYMSMKPLLKKARAVLQGEAHSKAHDEYVERDYSNLLLPFSPSMTQQQYDFYKSEAELPGLTTQYARVLISALLRKQSQLTLPEELGEDAYNWITKDMTLDGASLFNFLDAAIWEELQTSRAWVYIDRPTVSDNELEMMTPEERMTISPYPVLIKAENVINVQVKTHPVTRIKTLTRWVTHYITEEYDNDNPWHPNYIDTVCDHYLDEQGMLVLDYYRKESGSHQVSAINGVIEQEYEDSADGGFVLYDTVYPMKFGQRLQRIPAFL